jgi:hypothetical protein
LSAQINKPEVSYALNPMDEIFKGDILKTAKEFEDKESQDTLVESTEKTVLHPKKKKLNKKAERKLEEKENQNSSNVNLVKSKKNIKKKLGLKIKKKLPVNKKVKG